MSQSGEKGSIGDGMVSYGLTDPEDISLSSCEFLQPQRGLEFVFADGGAVLSDQGLEQLSGRQKRRSTTGFCPSTCTVARCSAALLYQLRLCPEAVRDDACMCLALSELSS